MTGSIDTGDVSFGDGRSGPVLRSLFGDRLGLIAFLGALCLFTVYWIVAWRINDSLTLLNALHGLTEGHLHIETVKYGSAMETPGTHRIGGKVYGRNYGVIVPSLVLVWAFQLLAAVAELRIVVAGLWSLGLLSIATIGGQILGQRRTATLAGSAIALAVFGLNVAFGTPLDPNQAELYALQVVHLIPAAFAVVFAYRLLAAIQDRPSGVLAAAMVGLGTPLGLWATIPKRHAVTTAVVLIVAYFLYRSRDGEKDADRQAVYRALAYASVGLLTWIHAPEALLVFVVLVAVDLPTAPRNDPWTLAIVGATFLLSMIPFLVTNTLISGSPVEPPRMLPSSSPTPGDAGMGGGNSGGSGSGGSSILSPILGPLGTALTPLTVLFGLLAEGTVDLVTRPGEFLTVFIRSGYVETAASESGHESIDLAILESAPVLAAVAGAVPALFAHVRGKWRSGLADVDWPPAPARTVDLFLGLFVVAFTLLYLSRLPLHVQITVRYLFPVIPALACLLCRLAPLRDVANRRPRLLAGSFGGGVLVGGQLVVLAVFALNPGVGEAFQLHAVLALVVAAGIAAWTFAAGIGRGDDRVGAVLLGLGMAASTVFLLLVAVEYFTVGDAQALPVVRALGERLALV